MRKGFSDKIIMAIGCKVVMDPNWLKWVKGLQAIAQTGLTVWKL